MMRMFALAPSFVVLLGSTAAGAQTTDPTAGHAGHAGMPGMPALRGAPAAASGERSALLTGPMGTRSPNGSVTVDGRTVRVSWSGDQAGTTRPWYVHRGGCGRDEGMVGGVNAYQAIVVGAGGAGTGTATLPEPLAADGAYFVAVHSGAAGSPSELVACGALGRAGGQMSHAGMPGMNTPNASMPGMSMSASQSAGQGMSGMDHSTMDMSGAGARANGSAGAMSSTMMADHMRMMADHMRIMSDHMRMMAEMSGATSGATSEGMGGTKDAGAADRPTGVRGRAASRRTPRPPAAQRPSAARTQPRTTTPPAPKADPMAGMDHSKMPMPAPKRP